MKYSNGVLPGSGMGRLPKHRCLSGTKHLEIEMGFKVGRKFKGFQDFPNKGQW